MAALFAATAADPIGPLLKVSATMGLRQGEALGLRWADVDLDAKTLKVSQTLDPHSHTLASTKTPKSRGELPIPEDALAALRDERIRQLERRMRAGRRWKDLDYVFSTEVGAAQDARNVTRRYHAARQRLGLPGVPWHHLRHDAATTLLGAGVPIQVVSRQLGHTSIATTMSFYGHVQMDALRDAARRMDDVMERASGG